MTSFIMCRKYYIAFIRLADAQTITVIMPYYFYANCDSKDCYRLSITAKLFANMLKRAGVDSVMILDSPTPQLEGFFDMKVDNLKVRICQHFVDHG